MNRLMTVGLVLALLAAAGVMFAQDHPEHPEKKDNKPAKTEEKKAERPEHPTPPPQSKQHAWLNQLVGEWEYTGEMNMGEGMDPVTFNGIESGRPVGDFWTISENKSTDENSKFIGVLTLGYSAEKGHYIGTWVDSLNDYMWNFTGELSDDKKSLALIARGPSMITGELCNFQEVITIVDDNHKTYTSSIQNEDGSWTQIWTRRSVRLPTSIRE